jgi:hypothetical protein
MKVKTQTVVVCLALAVLASAPSAFAGDITFGNTLTTVTVDGHTTALGSAVSVINDGSLYHMWYHDNSDTLFTIGGLHEATSSDGVNFTSIGALSFSNDPFPTGTAPDLYYENVSNVGGDYKLQHWTYNGGSGSFPAYNYNISVSDIGTNPDNLTVTHQGAIAGGSMGQTAGPFGIVGNYIYMQAGDGRQLWRGLYNDNNGGTPSVTDLTMVADENALFGSLLMPGGYLNNHSSVTAGSGDLHFFFTVRVDQSSARANEQVYQSYSTDGGATWSSPTGVFAAAPLDGSAPGGNFAHAQGVYDSANNQYRLYLSTKDSTGNYVIATALEVPAQETPEPGTLFSLGAGIVLIAVGWRKRRPSGI